MSTADRWGGQWSAPISATLDSPSASATKLHLGCGDDYRAGWTNVDANPDSPADIVADISETPWDFATANTVDRIDAHQLVEHLPDREAFFEECARVLAPDGRLTVSVPLGMNAQTDSDHEPPAWTYETPEQFSCLHRRPWDPDLPLELLDREVNVWLGGPLAGLTPLFQAAARLWPAWAAYRCYAGVLKMTFRKIDS